MAVCIVDYTIFAKVLARRLQSVVSAAVGNHQTCAIKGRSIVTNIHVTRSVFHSCTDSMNEIALLQVNVANPFDMVNHWFLFKLLQHINVGTILLEGYHNSTTSLIINSTLSTPIAVQACAKHGCPLSTLLFALYLERLSHSLICSTSIVGYRPLKLR